MLKYFTVLMYFTMAPMDPCDERNVDQVQNDSKFIHMKTAVNYNSSSIFYIMKARSILTDDDDEFGNNVGFMVCMDYDTYAQEASTSLSWDEKRDNK